MDGLRRQLGIDAEFAYAQTHPDRVSELVLRGIFLFRQSEVDWLYQYGASELYPEGWDEFIGLIPEAERGELVEAYHRRLTSDDPAVQLAAAKAWSKWEGLTVTLLPDPEMLAEFTEDSHAIPIARIECHYMRNLGWLEDGQLLKNAESSEEYSVRHRSGTARLLHAAERRLGPQEGVARGGLADRARWRPFVQRAGDHRRIDPRKRSLCEKIEKGESNEPRDHGGDCRFDAEKRRGREHVRREGRN